jgi:hypothetical protein
MLLPWLRQRIARRAPKASRPRAPWPLSRPGLERLEDRLAPAVTSTFNSGALVLTFSGTNNDTITIQSQNTAANDFNVNAAAGTTLDGTAGNSETFTGVVSITVNGSAATGETVTFDTNSQDSVITGAISLTDIDVISLTDSTGTGSLKAASLVEGGGTNATTTLSRPLLTTGAAGVSITGDTTITANSTIDASAAATGGISLTATTNIAVNSGATIKTDGGGITMDANQGATPTSGNFNGIEANGAAITSATGAILLQGKGGDTGSNNYGIVLEGGTTVSSTGTGAGAATITLIGSSGAGTSANLGILLTDAGTSVTSKDGAIQITGTGGAGTSIQNEGIVIQVGAQVSSTGVAHITLTGTGGGAGGVTDQNDGIFFLQSAGVAAVTTADGAIQITGTAGLGANSLAIDLGPNGGKVTSTGSGNITLTGDSMNLDTTDAGIDAGANTVTLEQKTNVALTVDASVQSGSLSLTDAELGLITAGQLVLGRDDSGFTRDLTVNSSITTHAGYSTLFLKSGGAVSESGGSSVAVTSLAIQASTGIGAAGAGNALATTVSSLEAATGTGGVFISNNAASPGPLSIGGVTASLHGVQVTGASGDIQLVNNGSITILTDGDIVSGPGNVTVQATGSTSDVSAGGQSSFASIRSLGGGTVTAEAGEDINLGNAAGFGVVGSVAGSVVLKAGRNITLNANAAAGVGSGTGTLTATAGGDITMLTSPGTLAGAPEFFTASGGISLTTGAGGTFTAATTGTDAVSSAGGHITISADNMVLNGGIDAGTGTVSLVPVTSGQAVTLGTTVAGTLSLLQGDLNEVTAGILRIGSGTAGDLTITAAVSASHFTTLTLISGGAISESGTGAVTVTNLDLQGAGGVQMTLNPSAVSGTLAGSTSTGAFSFADSVGFTVGTADTQSGITTGGHNLALIAGGLLTLGDGTATAENLTATGAVVSLNAAGVTEKANSSLSAGRLLLQGTGTFALNQSGNAVSTLAASVTGALAYRNGAALTVGSVTDPVNSTAVNGVTTGGHNLALIAAGLLTLGDGTATTENLTAAGATASLNAAGVSESANAVVTSGSLLLQGTGTFTLNQSGNAVSTLAANVTGALTYQNAAALTVGSVTDPVSSTAVNGVTTNGQSLGLTTTVGGDLTIAQAISAGMTTLTNAGQLKLNADVTAAGGFTQNGAGTVTTSGTRQLTTVAGAVLGGDISIATAVTLGGGLTASAGTGGIDFKSIVNGTFALAANSTGATTFEAAVGGTTPLASLTTDAGGTSSLQSVATTGAQTYNDTTITLNGAAYTTTANGNFSANGAAVLTTPATVATGSGVITFASTLNEGANLLTIRNSTSATSSSIAGAITGSGGLLKDGSSTLILAGTSPLYTGPTTIDAGAVLVNGLTKSVVSLSQQSASLAAVLGGIGTVAGIQALSGGGFVAPGTTGSTANLTSTGDVTLNNAKTFYRVKVNTSAFSVLQLTGGAHLNVTNAVLQAALSSTVTATADVLHSRPLIIDGTGPTSTRFGSVQVYTGGTFAGTPVTTGSGKDSTAFYVNVTGQPQQQYQLAYVGGSGLLDPTNVNVTLTHLDVLRKNNGTVLAPQNATGQNVPVANQAVATFSDDAGRPASTFEALIDWGDGTSNNPGQVTGPVGGIYTVLGSHTYAVAGKYPITVEIINLQTPPGTSLTLAQALAQAQTLAHPRFTASTLQGVALVGNTNAITVSALSQQLAGHPIDVAALNRFNNLGGLSAQQLQTLAITLEVASLQTSTDGLAMIVGQVWQQFFGAGTAPDARSLATYIQYLAQVGDREGLSIIVASLPAYFQKAGNNFTQWVTNLYHDYFNVALPASPATPSLIAHWVSLLQAGTSRLAVARAIITSRLGDEVQIQYLYKLVLGRNAAQVELDAWEQLRTRMSLNQIELQLALSAEFRAGLTGQGQAGKFTVGGFSVYDPTELPPFHSKHLPLL